jgi:orotidine-5'-phosphate decarboxylase
MIDSPSPGRERLCLALDEPSLEAAQSLLDAVGAEVGWAKVGLELYLAEGARAVELALRHGLKVFLDLKLHDIPATVAGAVGSTARLGVSLLTIHASGGRAMIAAAAEAAKKVAGGPRILGVTVLTSLDEKDLGETGCIGPVDELALRRATLTMEAGADGIVASPAEARLIRTGAPDGFWIVTPGIRPAGGEVGDQKRVATPAAAIAAGADLLVVGRPIRMARDPRAAAHAVVAEIEAALAELHV